VDNSAEGLTAARVEMHRNASLFSFWFGVTSWRRDRVLLRFTLFSCPSDNRCSVGLGLCILTFSDPDDHCDYATRAQFLR
jgi:hypothetical protein